MSNLQVPLRRRSIDALIGEYLRSLTDPKPPLSPIEPPRPAQRQRRIQAQIGRLLGGHIGPAH